MKVRPLLPFIIFSTVCPQNRANFLGPSPLSADVLYGGRHNIVTSFYGSGCFSLDHTYCSKPSITRTRSAHSLGARRLRQVRGEEDDLLDLAGDQLGRHPTPLHDNLPLLQQGGNSINIPLPPLSHVTNTVHKLNNLKF